MSRCRLNANGNRGLRPSSDGRSRSGGWRLAALTAIALAACAPPLPPEAPAAPAAACVAGDAPSCERAIPTASRESLPGLLEAYDRALGVAPATADRDRGGWTALASWLATHREPTVVVAVEGSQGAVPTGARPRFVLTAAARPTEASAPRMLLAVGTHAEAHHLVWRSDEQGQPSVRHLFPRDLLGPHTLGLPGIARGATEPGALEAELELSATVRSALEAARGFDYVAAAQAADALRAQLKAIAQATELTARARYVVNMLDSAAIALDTDEPEPEGDGPAPENHSAAATLSTAEPSSPQAAYLHVLLAGDDFAAAWQQRRPLVATELSDDRLKVLDQIYRPADQCPVRVVPPMDQEGDLLFGARLGTVLDATLPGAPPKRNDGPALPIAEWLPRYDAMVRLVDQTHGTWSFLPALLNERGELWGLSARGTATYLHVSELALNHLRALRALADHAPRRFRPLALLSLFQLRGLVGDARVTEELGSLTSHAVTEALTRAQDEESLYDAAMLAGMMAMSLPPALQGSHLTLIRQALGSRLAAGVSAKPWGLAGLHALNGLLGLVTGDAAALRTAASRAADALTDGRTMPYGSLAALAAAAARYVALAGTDALNPATANPNLFGPARAAASAALRSALAGLAEPAPVSPQERDLLAATAEVADALIAVVAQAVVGAPPTNADAVATSGAAGSCAADKPLSERSDLREPLARLDRGLRKLVARPAFRDGDSAWSRRARVVVLVLSDAVDLLSRGTGELRFRLAESDATRILEQGLAGWAETDWANIARGGYLLTRNALSTGGDRAQLSTHTAQLLRGLGATFAPGASATTPSIFEALAGITTATEAAPGTDQLSQLFVDSARRAYDREAAAQGDLLLFVAFGLAVAREEPVADEVIALARERKRPVALPLLAQSMRMRPELDPEPLFTAMRQLPKEHCFAPDPEPIIALRRVAYDYRAGRRDAAVANLERFVRDAERSGLVVPRVAYTYEESAGHKVLRLDGSLSWASDWLKGSGTLQAGIGVQSSLKAGGTLAIRFAEKTSVAAQEEATRVYAHAAAQLAVYQYLKGDATAGLAAAQRALGAWVAGVRLGDEGVAAADKTAEWAQDALGVIAIAAQQAAEAGHIFVAGDLWSLARAGLGAQADEAAVEEVLAKPPVTLAGIPELDAVIERARGSLRIVASGLPCTKGTEAPGSLLQGDCAGYPIALAYRVSDGLTALPRLKRGAEIGRPECAPLRALDEFLAAADARRYDPDTFTAAVTGLERGGRAADAAFLLARQRHPEHCSPALIELARALAARAEFGPHLRSDLLSIVANCSAGRVDAQLVTDIRTLDELTQQLPVAVRSLQVVLFAARLGLQLNRWEPLLALSEQPTFVSRWLRFGPEAGTAALLIHHAALAAADRPIDVGATTAAYQLLCTTYPPAERAPLCQTIGLLRSNAAPQDRKRTARDGLTALMVRLTGAGAEPSTPSTTAPDGGGAAPQPAQ